MQKIETPTLHRVENPATTLQLTLRICGVNQPSIVQYCSMYLVKKKKNPRIKLTLTIQTCVVQGSTTYAQKKYP